MSRRPRSRKSLRRADSFPVGWAALGGVVLLAIIGGFVWLYLGALERNPARDPETLCPQTGPTEQVLVLVDVTDPIGSITQQDVLNQLDEIADGLSKGGRFELRVLEAGNDRTRTIFSACNPGDGSDLDHWTGNPASAKRRWEERFDTPLRTAMDAALHAGEADTSPIMAAIQRIAVDRLGTAQARGIANRLILISDMLENTSAFSMYRSGPDYASYKVSKAPSEFGTDLAGAGVEVWLLRRDTRFPSATIAEFWANWTQDNKGRFLRALQLQGMSP